MLPFKTVNADNPPCDVGATQRTPVGKRSHVPVSCMTGGKGNIKMEASGTVDKHHYELHIYGQLYGLHETR